MPIPIPPPPKPELLLPPPLERTEAERGEGDKARGG